LLAIPVRDELFTDLYYDAFTPYVIEPSADLSFCNIPFDVLYYTLFLSRLFYISFISDSLVINRSWLF